MSGLTPFNMNLADQTPNSSAEDRTRSHGRVVCALVILLFTVFGLVLNSIFLFIYHRNKHPMFSNNSYYTLVHNLAIADVLFLLSHAVVAVPYTLTNCMTYTQVVDALLCHTISTSFYVISFSSFLIALNRFLIFALPNVNARVFSAQRSTVYCAASWMIAILLNVYHYVFLGYTMTFRLDEYFVISFQPRPELGEPSSFQVLVSDVLATFLPSSMGVAMLVLYVLAFWMLAVRQPTSSAQRYKSTNEAARRRRRRRRYRSERSLLVQGFLIGLSLIVTNAVFSVARYAPEERYALFLSFMQSCAAPLNSVVSPIIYFTLNTDVRACWKRMIYGSDVVLTPSQQRARNVTDTLGNTSLENSDRYNALSAQINQRRCKAKKRTSSAAQTSSQINDSLHAVSYPAITILTHRYRCVSEIPRRRRASITVHTDTSQQQQQQQHQQQAFDESTEGQEIFV